MPLAQRGRPRRLRRVGWAAQVGDASKHFHCREANVRGLVIGLAAFALMAAPLEAGAVTDWAKAERNAAMLRDKALAGSLAYPILSSLTTEIGPRLEGSEAEHRAALWAAAKLKSLGFQRVHIESFPVNGWTRGEERAAVITPAPQRLLITALGNSSATPPEGIEADIALFQTYADFLTQPPGSLAGKIAVVIQPMVRTQDGSGYGMINAMRTVGPLEAAKRGAVAYMIRSLATGDMRSPHTGAALAAGIPAVALAVPDAEQLGRLAALGKPVRVRLISTPTVRSNATADTVIGEIPGREKPDEIVLIGGHLDSWDLGTGAIDDGAGVAITTAAAKLIADMAEPPRRTIRIALFGSEELNFSNTAYARAHPADEQSRHVIASECDFGAEPPYRIALPAGAGQSPYGRVLGNVVAPLKIYIDRGLARDGGADLEALMGVPVAELAQDGTHYFDYHHSPDDTLDKTDPRQMDKAVAAWVAFTYLAADSDVDFRALAAAAPASPSGHRP
jgi:hypothetical protein